MRALRHRYNLRTHCQKILGRPAVAATDTYLSRKRLGRDCLYLPIDQSRLGRNYLYLPIDQSQLGRDFLCLPIERTRVMTWTGLPMSIDRKDTSYDSILIVVDRLTKMVYSEPVQIPINAPRLPDSIVSDKDSVFTSKFWSPRYQFRARLRLHDFELIARVSYEEDIILHSRFN